MFPTSTVIMIVDDSEIVREDLRGTLQTLGYQHFIEAADGNQAYIRLINADQKKVPVGLIFCDWNMPHMQGIELLQKVRYETKWKNLPFIMVTTQSASAEVVQAIASDVSGYIIKPFDTGVIAEKLESVWKRYNKPKA